VIFYAAVSTGTQWFFWGYRVCSAQKRSIMVNPRIPLPPPSPQPHAAADSGDAVRTGQVHPREGGEEQGRHQRQRLGHPLTEHLSSRSSPRPASPSAVQSAQPAGQPPGSAASPGRMAPRSPVSLQAHQPPHAATHAVMPAAATAHSAAVVQAQKILQQFAQHSRFIHPATAKAWCQGLTPSSSDEDILQVLQNSLSNLTFPTTPMEKRLMRHAYTFIHVSLIIDARMDEGEDEMTKEAAEKLHQTMFTLHERYVDRRYIQQHPTPEIPNTPEGSKALEVMEGLFGNHEFLFSVSNYIAQTSEGNAIDFNLIESHAQALHQVDIHLASPGSYHDADADADADFQVNAQNWLIDGFHDDAHGELDGLPPNSAERLAQLAIRSANVKHIENTTLINLADWKPVLGERLYKKAENLMHDKLGKFEIDNVVEDEKLPVASDFAAEVLNELIPRFQGLKEHFEKTLTALDEKLNQYGDDVAQASIPVHTEMTGHFMRNPLTTETWPLPEVGDLVTLAVNCAQATVLLDQEKRQQNGQAHIELQALTGRAMVRLRDHCMHDLAMGNTHIPTGAQLLLAAKQQAHTGLKDLAHLRHQVENKLATAMVDCTELERKAILRDVPIFFADIQNLLMTENEDILIIDDNNPNMLMTESEGILRTVDFDFPSADYSVMKLVNTGKLDALIAAARIGLSRCCERLGDKNVTKNIGKVFEEIEKTYFANLAEDVLSFEMPESATHLMHEVLTAINPRPVNLLPRIIEAKQQLKDILGAHHVLDLPQALEAVDEIFIDILCASLDETHRAPDSTLLVELVLDTLAEKSALSSIRRAGQGNFQSIEILIPIYRGQHVIDIINDESNNESVDNFRGQFMDKLFLNQNLRNAFAKARQSFEVAASTASDEVAQAVAITAAQALTEMRYVLLAAMQQDEDVAPNDHNQAQAYAKPDQLRNLATSYAQAKISLASRHAELGTQPDVEMENALMSARNTFLLSIDINDKQTPSFDQLLHRAARAVEIERNLTLLDNALSLS
jgi:hypothetical protein